MKKYLGAMVVAGVMGAMGLGSSQALAVSVSCPGTAATTDREFTLDITPSATCAAYGSGNISGNPGGGNPDPIFTLFSNIVLLDKTDDGTSGLFPAALSITGAGTGAGTITFNLPLGFGSFVLGMKSGNGQFDPDWVAFLIPAGVTSGSWTVSVNGLSHFNLYGVRGETTVPVPGALPLLLTGLGGLGWLARRRAKKA